MKKKPFKKVIVAATGSVGAAVVPQIILYARLNYANEVHLIVSESALKFITPYAAKLYSGNNLLDDAFTSTDEHLVPHIQIFEDADMMLVLPATANIIAKAAHGIADEVVSLSILAASCPVVFVPSMNEIMWNKKIVQKNVAELRRAGHVVIEPVVGLEISTLTPSNGCMPPVDQVFASLAAAKIAIAGKKKSPNKK